MPASDRRGITLLETLVSLVIVSMTAVAALKVVSSQLQLAERSRRALQAEALSTLRLDYMGLLTDAELLQLPDTVEKGTFDYPLDEYSWLVTSDPGDQPGVYAVSINIQWPDDVYTVRTFMYRRPLVRTVAQ